ncbi:Pumilio homolog 24 [Linum grandiflorum]
MAADKVDGKTSTKRKQSPGHKAGKDGAATKKPKFVSSNADDKKPKKPFNPKQGKSNHSGAAQQTNEPLSKRDLRIQAKELADARKMKRKRHYSLEQELARLWEKMRRRNIGKEERSKLISEAIQKMKGKIPEIATSHVSSRVLQTCAKYCSQSERDDVFTELRPHFLNFACNPYAVHLVKKMLDSASKKQLGDFISSLRGHIASLLRHMVGSVVVEHVYQAGNGAQRQELLLELYSTELQLFKDLSSIKENRLVDVISKLNLQKPAVSRHMNSVIQPILEKGIVDHSIIHRVIMEYFSIADKSSAADIVQQLSSALLVRMIHTKDGSRIGVLCVKHGSAKERKKIVKGMKSHILKIALDQYGSVVLACILSTVDDTKIMTKIVVRELQSSLKDLILDKNGRRPILQLLHPNCSRYFSPDEIASLNSSIPSLSAKAGVESSSKVDVNDETKTSTNEESGDGENDVEDDTMAEGDETEDLVEGGKKDPSIRRRELLVESGLAENVIDVCTEKVEELLRSNFGKEVLYEVATGGSEGILLPSLGEKLTTLHEAIAIVAAESKYEDAEKEHVFENFHASRTIRKLVLDSPGFAAILWKKALKGKCSAWAKGHSSKVIQAFLDSTDEKVRKLANSELQPLIKAGILKRSEAKETGKDV